MKLYSKLSIICIMLADGSTFHEFRWCQFWRFGFPVLLTQNIHTFGFLSDVDIWLNLFVLFYSDFTKLYGYSGEFICSCWIRYECVFLWLFIRVVSLISTFEKNLFWNLRVLRNSNLRFAKVKNQKCVKNFCWKSFWNFEELIFQNLFFVKRKFF